MIMAGIATITLELDSVAEILTDHAGYPDASGPHPRSGLDELLVSAGDLPADSPIHIVLRLPPDEIDSHTAASVREALAAQCAERIDANEGILADVREKVVGRLLTSLFVVAGLLAVVVLAMFTLSPLEFLRPMLGGVLALGVWAIVANPIRTYQWQWRPRRRQIADCRRIMAATVDVEVA